MRIISDYHDYYDSIQKMGMDEKLVYLRKIKEIPIDGKYDDRKGFFSREVKVGYYSTSYNKYDINCFLIGFCGEIYPIVKINKYTSDYSSTPYSFFKKTWEKGEISHLLNEDGMKYKRYSAEYFASDFLHAKYNQWKEIFYTHKIPIFIVGRRLGGGQEKCIELNGELKSLQFYKIKDPYTAYQDIYQFLGGVLGIDAPKTVEISDASKITKHGFDKWTFRTMPKNKK